MAEPTTLHVDLAGYLLGGLETGERARFESHLDECAECRQSLSELAPVPALLDQIAPAHEPPADLGDKVAAAVRGAADGPPARSLDRARRGGFRLRLPRLALAACVVAALALAVLAGALLAGGEGEPGTLELRATLTAPGAEDARADAEVRNTGTGRVVEFASDDLPILPTGELYELWFVGPRDTPERPYRISAGTFHPDEEGRSRVRMHAAVDPAKYPVLSVTAEPGDGNPARSGPEVLRSAPPP